MGMESNGSGANMHRQGRGTPSQSQMVTSQTGIGPSSGRPRPTTPFSQRVSGPAQNAPGTLGPAGCVVESWSDGTAPRFWGSHCPPPTPERFVSASTAAEPELCIPTEWQWGDPERSHFAQFVPREPSNRHKVGSSTSAPSSHADMDHRLEFEWKEPPQPSSMEGPADDLLEFSPDMIPEGEGSGTRRPRLLLLAYAGIATIVTAVFFYLLSPGNYRIDANLLFLCAQAGDPSGRAWQLEKEVEILKSPRVLHLASRELVAGKASREGVQGSFGVPARSGGVAAQPDLPDYTATTEWLSEKLSVTSQPSTGMATVSITGQDPERLREAMHAYLKHYARHRSELAADAALSGNPGQAGSTFGRPASVWSEIRNELEKVIAQQHECEMALKFMDSGKGPFRGFLPESNLTWVPSLSAFQNKIVELEIKKQSLGARFTTESKDVQAIIWRSRACGLP